MLTLKSIKEYNTGTEMYYVGGIVIHQCFRRTLFSKLEISMLLVYSNLQSNKELGKYLEWSHGYNIVLKFGIILFLVYGVVVKAVGTAHDERRDHAHFNYLL